LFDVEISFDVLYCTDRVEYSVPSKGTNWGGGNGVVRLSLGSGVAVDNNQWKATLYGYGYGDGVYGPVVSTISRGGVAEIDFEEKYDISTDASGYVCYAVVEFSINGVQYTETTDAVYYP